jgi:hypothetical protein
MSIKVGTLLTPKYSRDVENCVVVVAPTAPNRGNMEPLYVIETIKSKNRTLLTEQEIYIRYNIIKSDTNAGKILFTNGN